MAPILTPRLTLRPPVAADAQPLMAVFADPLAMQYVGHGETYSLEQVQRSIQRRAETLLAHSTTLWTVTLRETDEVIGDCGLIPVAWKGPDFELAYHFAPHAWGKGYATEAARAALDHAWQHTRLTHAVGLTYAANIPSQRVLTKAGFADLGETSLYYDLTLRHFHAQRPG